jgi:PAS domain S-box-containing protein
LLIHVRTIFVCAAVLGLCAVFYNSSARGENPYSPRLVDPLTESWRWREFPQVKGRGLNCLDEGADGAMWFGIEGGALRYDGLRWTEFNKTNGLPATATAFALTDDGFYASTRSAIYAFENEQWREVFPGSTQLVWVIEDLIAAKDGSLWAATSWGALQITNPQQSAASQQWTLYAARQVAAYFDADPTTRFTTVVVESPDSNQWESGSGIYVYGPIPNGQLVIALAEEGPAVKAGLKIGDQIVGINGEEHRTVFQKEIDTKPGSQLELTVKRPGKANLLSFFLTTEADIAGVCETFRPYAIAEANDGTMWFATRLGRIISLSSAEDGSTEGGSTEDGSTEGGLRKWTHHTDEYNLPSVAVPSITATADGVAVVGRSTLTRALNQFDGQRWQVTELKLDIGSSIISLPDQRLLIGSDGAVITIGRGVNTIRSTQQYGIEGNDVLIKQSTDGAIWIAGKGSTVLRVEPQGNWTTYQGIIYQATNQDGSEWFISNRLSVVQRDGENWREYTTDDGLMTIPTTVLATKSGEVWVAGSQNGIAATARLENGKWNLQEHPRLSWSIDRRAVFEDRDGRVWFGGASVSVADPGMLGGAVRYDAGTWKHIEPTNRLTYCYQMCQTKDGSIWVGGPSLVQILPNDRFGDLSHVPDKANGYCECCASDNDGNLWSGTRNHGLMKMSQTPDGDWSAIWFDEANGISNNRIRNILPLADGTVVAHTADGFHRFDGRSWNRPAFPEQIARQVDNAGIRQSPDGAIWFTASTIGSITPESAKSGVSLESPQSFRTWRYVADFGPPETQLESKFTEILVGDDRFFSWTGTDQWNVTPSSQLTYSWRVDDNEWSPFTTETLTKISGVSPGAHRLEVRSRDQDFNIDATPTVTKFEVIPLLHNRTWFRLLMLFTLGMLGFALVQTGRVFRREARLRVAHGELVAAEQQLLTANLVLEDRVVERTNELRETNQQLSREIEERISAEAKLQESEQRYRSLVEMLPSGVQRIDLEGKIVFGNPTLAQLRGCSLEEVIGEYIWDFESTEENRQSLKSYFSELIKHQPPPTPYESSNRTVDGRVIDIFVNWTYDRDAHGELAGFVSVVSDVTERKKAEELIRAENELLEAVTRGEPLTDTLERLTAFVESQAPDLIASVLLLDDDGQHLRHMAGAGLPRAYVSTTDGVAIGEAVGSCGTAAFRSEPVFVSDIANDPLWEGVSHLATDHDLAACWSTPITDTDGTLLGTFALYRQEPGGPTAEHLRLMDIVTHMAALTIGRNRSQYALQESERRFRTIFEQVAVGVAQLDSTTGRILRVNQRYCEIMGSTEADLVGRTWMELTPETDIEIDRANMTRLIQGEIREFAIEKRMRRDDGTLIWIDLHVSPMWQAGEEATEHIAIIQDVTLRKKARDELVHRQEVLVKLDEKVRELFLNVRRGEQFFESICRDIEALVKVDLCAVPLVDSNGTTFTYRAASGVKADLLFGKSMPISGGGLCGWVIDHHQTLCIADLSSDARVIPELAAALDVTTAILAPLAIEGRIIGGLSLFRNEKPFTEFELRTLNLYAQSVAAAYENWLTLSSLEARVFERTKKLAETNAELDSFARNVSHDLRAPLRAMEGFAAALAEDYGDQIDDEGHEFINHIIDSAKRMDGMVADLLAYSRLGRTELRLTSIGLNEIVREALNRLGSEIAVQHALIEVAEDMPKILGHKSMLVQVMVNLVSNALKFVHSGTQPEVCIWSDPPANGRVRLTIQDNGIGVEEAYQERIFQVFERLHGIESYPGTGIGLAIVTRACERLGGTCGMESSPGLGSRFWVEFPEGQNCESE